MTDTYKIRKDAYLEKTKKSANTGMKFTTVSGKDVDILYSPDDIKSNQEDDDENDEQLSGAQPKDPH